MSVSLSVCFDHSVIKLDFNFNRVLQRCNVEVYETIGNMLSDFTAHEKAVNVVVDMLRKDQVIYYEMSYSSANFVLWCITG